MDTDRRTALKYSVEMKRAFKEKATVEELSKKVEDLTKSNRKIISDIKKMQETLDEILTKFR